MQKYYTDEEIHIGMVHCVNVNICTIVELSSYLLYRYGEEPAVLCMSIIYAAVSMINTSILSIYPLRFLQTGNVASVSGVMDFATYLGASVSGVIYGALKKNFGYTPMFVSWVCISLISIILIKKVKTV